jgi:cell division transport system permease protein
MGVIALFNFSVADIAKLYASDFRLSLPSFQANLTIILSAVTLGLVSSYLAVSKSLAYLNNN